jgi:hypothetical protein
MLVVQQYFLGNNVVHGSWDQTPDVEIISAAGKRPRRVWLVFSHVVSDATRAFVQADLEVVRGYARQVRVVQKDGAEGWLFELR